MSAIYLITQSTLLFHYRSHHRRHNQITLIIIIVCAGFVIFVCWRKQEADPSPRMGKGWRFTSLWFNQTSKLWWTWRWTVPPFTSPMLLCASMISNVGSMFSAETFTAVKLLAFSHFITLEQQTLHKFPLKYSAASLILKFLTYIWV